MKLLSIEFKNVTFDLLNPAALELTSQPTRYIESESPTMIVRAEFQQNEMEQLGLFIRLLSDNAYIYGTAKGETEGSRIYEGNLFVNTKTAEALNFLFESRYDICEVKSKH